MTIKLDKEDRDIIFETIKEMPIPVIGLAGLFETVSAFGGQNYLSAAVANDPYSQIKLYVNTFTLSAVSASALYLYSNRINKWISSTAGIIG